MTYEAFRGSGLDLSAVGFMPGGEAYFCTPVGAAILGRAGVDGIHFCTAPETGDMILAVSPANGAEDCIHPVARDFPDFLRLLLACGDTAALEQSWMWSEEQFAAFLRENPPTPEGETALAALRARGVTPMEEPYRYLHALQAGFDPGVLRYSREYRELRQETEEELPWRVSFHGGLIGHGGRAGKAIPADTWFTWEGEDWYVPALYRCPEGIVVDILQRVDVEDMWAYCGKWKLTPETDWDAMPEERWLQARGENPFCHDFRAVLTVNGQTLSQRHGCGSVWLPLWPDREEEDMKAVLRHYGLDEGDCWQLWRVSFEWAGEKPRKCKDLALILFGEEDVPGPSFQAERAGQTVPFRHPVTGEEHILTVRSIEPQDYDRPEDPGWDYPRHFIALGYTVTPDIPQEEFSVRDCAPADPARRKPDAPKDQLGGGTAVLFFASRDGEDPSLRMTASSMRFTPPERVTWRIHFHIVSRGEVTVELPGE